MYPLVTRDSLVAYAQQLIAAARGLTRNGLVNRRFAMPLLDVNCWTSDGRFLDLCEDRLASGSPDAPARATADIFVIDATHPGWPAPAVWDVTQGLTSRDFEATLENAGLRGFYHHEAPSWQLNDPATRTGVHSLPYPSAFPPWESGSPLRLFLHWAYAHMGLRLTHAATLGHAGVGALVAGPSGSGKSGTALAGLLNGLESAGDDYVVLEQGDAITAHAVFRIFKQDPEGLRRVGLEPAACGSATLNWHGKHEFNAEALRPDGFVKRLSIGAILVPEVARLRRTRIEPLPSARAALALAPSAVLQLQGDARQGFRFFAELARKLPAFRVRLSEDPREIAGAIGEHLMKGTRNAG